MRRLVLIAGLLLSACNLQQQPPTPTPPPTVPEPQTIVTVTPQQPAPDLPTLLPTPTQWGLVTATLPAAPTTINSGTGNPAGQPTLDAAQADESYDVTLRDGASIGVNYEVTIDSTGVVTMVMQGPDGVVWQKSFTASDSGRAEVTVQQGGAYEILVYRQNLDGSYSVSWD